MKTRIEKIKEFLRTLNVDHLDIPYFAEEDHQNFDDLYSAIDENGGFNIEIIYYQTAIEYLMSNDNSLRESLQIASDLGYECKNLNSEVLASLLASENVRTEFNELQAEIDKFFEQLNSEEEETEETE
jgi:hypothetical protein